MSALADLIARLEAATEGSMDLDHEVDRAIGKPVRWPAPHYTRSLDAALTLMPEGWDWCLSQGSGEPAKAALSPAVQTTEAEATAPTAALALCIAALRARESSR